jgi:hypothetical protein
MPGPVGVISIPSDEKDAIICVDKTYREAVAVEATEAAILAKESNGKKEANRDTGKGIREAYLFEVYCTC